MNLLEARLAKSRQRALDLADRLEEADRRACEAEQQLASEKQQHKIMDAAYWAVKEQLAKQTAALGALSEALESISNPDDLREEAAPPLGRTEMQKIAEQALAPDAVQQAIAVAKAKDAEIEQLKAARKDAEARLAVAMGLLESFYHRYVSPTGFCLNCDGVRNQHEIDCWFAPIQQFLADPSQAAEEYHASIQPLFQLGDFTFHSGSKSRWKIECDALKDSDWDTLAAVIAERQPFSRVIGVPSQEGHKPNGLILAKALEKYATTMPAPILVVDDVLTTGNSIKETMAEYPDSIGWVVFAHGDCPPGVQALFQMPTAQYRRAMQVVERVKDVEKWSEQLDMTRDEAMRLQSVLLGDAAQEESHSHSFHWIGGGEGQNYKSCDCGVRENP